MTKKESVAWECECGNLEYGQYPPEECNKCWELDSFSRAVNEEEEE